MNMRSHRILAAFLCLALFAALGCALPSPVPVDDGASATYEALPEDDASAAAPESVAFLHAVDMAGRSISLDAYAARVVALDPADCEILCSIGAEGLLVGRGWDCDYPSTIATLPPVSTQIGPDPEKIIALTPDLVVTAASAISDEQLAAFEQAGIPVALTDPQDIAGVYTAITLLGTLTNRTSEANALVAEMVTAFATLKAQTTQDGMKTVYFELSSLEDGLTTGGSGTILNDLALTVGLHNEFEDMTGWPVITPDQVAGRGPDYIVAAIAAGEDGAMRVSEILSRAGWEDVDAVKQSAVFYIDGKALTRAGPRLVDAASMLLEATSGQS